MTTAALIKQIWALPAGEREKIRNALEKHCDDEFYRSEGMTREEFDVMITKSRASGEPIPMEKVFSDLRMKYRNKKTKKYAL